MKFERPGSGPRDGRPGEARFPKRENFSREEPPRREASPEADYLRRLASEQTPVVVHLRTGERFEGFVEYYDRRFIRLTREGAPNLFLFKQDIKYLSEK